jgi:hypothetical protein
LQTALGQLGPSLGHLLWKGFWSLGSKFRGLSGLTTSRVAPAARLVGHSGVAPWTQCGILKRVAVCFGALGDDCLWRCSCRWPRAAMASSAPLRVWLHLEWFQTHRARNGPEFWAYVLVKRVHWALEYSKNVITKELLLTNYVH